MKTSATTILIKNGQVVDPANQLNAVTDILIENGRIAGLIPDMQEKASQVIDARGRIVMPGIVDMHAHLREPGREDKETVASGTRAALKGGVTSILAMPNTQPPMDAAKNIRLLKGIIEQTALAQVFICGTITKGRLGAELADIAELKAEGAIAISDDGASVESEELMFKALAKAAKEDILVICHCEDKNIAGQGVVNLGIVSTRLGLRGLSQEAEYQRIARELDLAEKTQTRIHIAHLSCKESIDLIARAKKKGVRVTAEVTPHHLALRQEEVLGFDTNMKMNPPLRSERDIAALKEGLKSGVIDAVASDHAPHTENEKEIEFERAEFGTIGLETMLAVSITELVNSGILDWPGLVRKLCLNPARILGVNKGTLSPGSDADLAIVSPQKQWQVRKDDIYSKSKNSAFLGRTLTGRVEYTLFGGKIVYHNPETGRAS